MSGLLSSPLPCVPATARPGITLAELDALRETARLTTDRALRHDAQPGDAAYLGAWIEKGQRLHAVADAAFETFRAAYFGPHESPDVRLTRAYLTPGGCTADREP